MKKEEIISRLFDLRDEKYAQMQYKIIPSVDTERIIGVRTPDLKVLAKQICKDEDTSSFLRDLPHEYFDMDQLHAFVICLEKNFDRCIEEVDRFLPYIDNWATCDQLSPNVFKKNKEELLEHVFRWMDSDETYTIRFGVGMLMQYYLDEGFRVEYAEKVASIRSDEYYVNIMRAWYFASALTKQYDTIIPFIEERRLDVWTHNKAIQKSVESYRVSDEHKAYLKTLRIKGSAKE